MPPAAHSTYEAMAPLYDAFSAHHDYELWLSHLLPALERHGLRGRRLLDVACGTGKSFQPLIGTEWELAACDSSAAMLEVAAAKSGGAVRLHEADMRALPRFGEFDLVWALGDALNYVLEIHDLRDALVSFRRNLPSGGLVLFDLNTLLTYRTFYGETETWEVGDWQLSWRGETCPDPPAGTLAQATFEACDRFAASGAPVCRAVHRQRHYPREEVELALREAELELLDVYGHHFDAVLKQPPDEALHTKFVYIAKASDEGR